MKSPQVARKSLRRANGSGCGSARTHRRVLPFRAVDGSQGPVHETVVMTAPAQSAQPVAELAACPNCVQQSAPPAPTTPLETLSSYVNPTTAVIAAGALLAAYGIKKIYDTPSRAYDKNVGKEYDEWTEEGVVEYYWGEHIHLGYYSDEDVEKGYLRKDLLKSKEDFIDEMLTFSESKNFTRVLDVGCGIGGTTRYLAAKYPNAQFNGITLSPKQVERGTELAKGRGLNNVQFQVMDAMDMKFEDNTFDLVWACESGEHMPDKRKYIEEMTRVLKPGGTMVIACWCQREETPDKLFSLKDKENLQFLYDEWAHPFFISYLDFARLMQRTGDMDEIRTADWTKYTLPHWRHTLVRGFTSPWIVLKQGPFKLYKYTREAVTIERMHRAFERGLMQYGMIRGTKAAPKTTPSVQNELAEATK